MRRIAAVAIVGLMIGVVAMMAVGCSAGGAEPAAPVPQGTFVPLQPGLTPVQSGFADVNGGRLYYEVYGEGEPLLLIMGLGANHLAWASQVPEFAREFQVIVFDNRGTGQSDLPEGTDLSIPLMADDASALLDFLGLDSAHVYGVSMGGMIAQELALRHPEKVRSLILGATSPGGPHSVPPGEQAIAPLIEQGTGGAGAVSTGLLDLLFSPEYLAEHGTQVLQQFSGVADYPPTSAEGFAAQLQAASHHDTYDRLPNIAAPTLVLHGTDDPLLPAGNARILADRIPGAELILFEGSRHAYMDKVDEANAAVLDFLRAHSGE